MIREVLNIARHMSVMPVAHVLPGHALAMTVGIIMESGSPSEYTTPMLYKTAVF